MDDGPSTLRELLTLLLLGEKYINQIDDLNDLDHNGEPPDLALSTTLDPKALKGLEKEGLVKEISEDGSIARLSQEGIAEAIMIIGHLGETIRNHIESDNAIVPSAWGEKPPFPVPAFVLRVSLVGCRCWRRIVMPTIATFRDLHQVIQVAFNWFDYHLYNFSFKVGGREIHIESPSNRNPFDVFFGIGDSENEELDEDDPLMTELGDMFPIVKNVLYTYDFGDDWEHKITLEKIIEDYEDPLPACLGGRGDTPPEDVGGRYGYKEFKDIIAGPESEERTEMFDWAIDQGFESFDCDVINSRIKSLAMGDEDEE